MGSPGPRALGADVIETPRFCASLRATRPDRAVRCGRSRSYWRTTTQGRSLRRPRSTLRPTRSTVTASLRICVRLFRRVDSRACRMTAISCLDDVADYSTVGDDDRASFLWSGCRSRLHGWIPMAVDGTSAPAAQGFSPAASPRKGAPIGIPRAKRLRRQNSWLRPGRSASLALRPRLAGSGSVSSFRPSTDRHRNGAQPHKMEKDNAQHRRIHRHRSGRNYQAGR
jgi:hypothetical protein